MSLEYFSLISILVDAISFSFSQCSERGKAYSAPTVQLTAKVGWTPNEEEKIEERERERGRFFVVSAEIKASACLHNGYSSKKPPHTQCLAVPLIEVGRGGCGAAPPPPSLKFFSLNGRSNGEKEKKDLKRIM